jgi:hypothetical protein
MGIEAFGVSLRFAKLAVCDQIKNILASYPQIRFAENKRIPVDEIVGEYDDGTHFIDFQIREVADNDCTLAIRFSLCSYDSIDSIFIDIMNNILSSFEADVWLMNSALKQKTNYLPGDQKWLIAALPDEIIAMRNHWQQLFGKKQGRVRVKDSFSFVGLKLKT